jgi:membrane fusion protein (multidrug efflux system)
LTHSFQLDNISTLEKNPPESDGPTSMDAPATASDSAISTPPAPPTGLASPRVRIGLSITASVVILFALIAGTRWLVHGRFIESTDDAYLRADVVTIAPRVSGYIDAIYVIDNQKVVAGQPLLRIDPRNYTAAFDQQKATVDARHADIGAAESQIAQQQAQVLQTKAQLAGAQANERYARAESARYKSLRDQGAETDERYAQAENDYHQAAATLAATSESVRVAERQVATLLSQVKQMRAQLEAAQAGAQAARLNVDDTLVRASIDGRVGDNSARLGQYTQPGTRLMSIVPTQNVYLVANFKETQLKRMRVGQPAEITVDAIGSQKIPGWLESFAPGTGAQFALLPPENATGNFIKIVQRVPVRFHLNPPKELVGRLLPGLSVTVDVDTNKNDHPP